MLKVVKFGGSSLANAQQIKKACEIIRAEKSRRYVVPSAPGRRFKDDTKVTDLLYKMYDAAKDGEDFSSVLSEIKSRYEDIIKGLSMEYSLNDEFAVIEKTMKENPTADYAASRGEYLNGRVISKYLGFDFVDAKTVIFFDENGRLDTKKTADALKNTLKDKKYALVPGFYGCGFDGNVKTFSRGGSDITGSLVANAVKADIYENWTDVSGVLVTDPRVVKNPETIKKVTYSELRELSYMGASVLHEDAVFPVRSAGIPINIKNTNRPEDAGTLIVPESLIDDEYIPYTITGIAGKKGFSVVNIKKEMLNNEMGFCAELLNILYRNDIQLEHLPTGIDTISIVVESKYLEGKKEKVINEIKEKLDPEKIDIEDGVALLAVVGRGMRKTRGTAARIFAALAHGRINIKMIDQGSSEMNIIIGVSEDDFEDATNRIYDVFVSSKLDVRP